MKTITLFYMATIHRVRSPDPRLSVTGCNGVKQFYSFDEGETEILIYIERRLDGSDSDDGVQYHASISGGRRPGMTIQDAALEIRIQTRSRSYLASTRRGRRLLIDVHGGHGVHDPPHQVIPVFGDWINGLPSPEEVQWKKNNIVAEEAAATDREEEPDLNYQF